MSTPQPVTVLRTSIVILSFSRISLLIKSTEIKNILNSNFGFFAIQSIQLIHGMKVIRKKKWKNSLGFLLVEKVRLN